MEDKVIHLMFHLTINADGITEQKCLGVSNRCSESIDTSTFWNSERCILNIKVSIG